MLATTSKTVCPSLARSRLRSIVGKRPLIGEVSIQLHDLGDSCSNVTARAYFAMPTVVDATGFQVCFLLPPRDQAARRGSTVRMVEAHWVPLAPAMMRQRAYCAI
jgi:hypothetical protein